MRRGTSVLPHFPGLRATKFTRPGQHGESQAQYAPLEPRVLELNMRFLPICTNPQNPAYQQVGRTFDERMAFLEENINEFMFRTMIGQTSSKGYLQIKRRNAQFEHFPHLYEGGVRSNGDQVAVGRILASSDHTLDPDANFADYDFIFELPEGTWYTAPVERRFNDLTANTTHTFALPMGTAPVWDTKIALRPRGGPTVMDGTEFTNDMGLGFRIRQNRRGSEWTIVDTLTRAAGRHAGGSPDWDIELTNFNEILELGRPQGTSLLVNPGVDGDGRRIGHINVRLNSPGEVAFLHHPRFF